MAVAGLVALFSIHYLIAVAALVGALIVTGKMSSHVVDSISYIATYTVKVNSVKQVFNKFEQIEMENNDTLNPPNTYKTNES